MIIHLVLSLTIFFNCLANQTDKNQDPRYVSGLIHIKHLKGFEQAPSAQQWSEYEKIQKNCSSLDSWLMHLLIEIYTYILQDQSWKVEHIQELNDCKTFTKTIELLKQKYPKYPR